MITPSVPLVAQARPAAALRDGRGIIAYLLINFGLTWSLQFYLLAGGARFDKPSATVTLATVVMMFFPALSAFIVRRWVTREGFATAGLRFGSWKPYVVVWLGTPAVFAVAFLISSLLGTATFDTGMSGIITTAKALTPVAVVLAPGLLAGIIFAVTMTFSLLLTCVATFGEEFGWTGFLLPKLLPLGKWRAALLYGLIWGLWHAPIIVGGYNYPNPVVGVFAMCLFTCAIGLTMTALRLRYRSVLLTTWVHGAVNSQGQGIWALLFISIHPLLGGIMGLPGLVVLVLIGVWLLARTPEPDLAA